MRVGPAVRAAWIHVNSDRPVMLQLLTADETRWRPVCMSPCDVVVPLDGAYRVVAPGIQASREVELEAGSGDRVVLDVNVRTNKEHLTAERLNIAGYVVGAAGLALEIVALSVDASSDAESALVWGGVAAAATAVALTITSYVMLQPTGLSQSSATPASGVVARAAIPTTRAPLWRDLASGGATLPRVTAVPVVSLSF